MNFDLLVKDAIAAFNVDNLSLAKLNFEKAIKLKSNNAETYNNLGIVYYKLKKLKKAKECYKKAIELKPDFAQPYFNLGVIFTNLNNYKEAISNYEKTIMLQKDFAKAYNNLGVAQYNLNKLKDAEISYKKAIEIKTDYAEAYFNISIIFYKIGKLKEAETGFKKTIEFDPDNAEAYNNLGNTLEHLGKIEEAAASYQKSIDIKPNFILGHYNLSQIKDYKKKDNQFNQMQKLSIQNITKSEYCNLNFALGKASEDLKEFDKSFKFYLEGNKINKIHINYNIQKDVDRFNEIKKLYPSFKKQSLNYIYSDKEIKPIFIIGMPRSGTTLVEQIISSHSKVAGAGELTYISEFGDLLIQGIQKVDSNTLLDFKKKYLEKLDERSDGNQIVTDKMPLNFRYIDLIFSIFPNTKIVHVTRDPSATCWSNYKLYFSSNKYLDYSYDLNDIISYYRLYEDLMQFYKKNYGSRIYDVDYDKLTNNQESEIKKLILSLDLRWEEKCLTPQNNKRIIRTHSNKQVIKKIYQGSSQKWKKFEPFLNGVFNKLSI